MLVFSSLLLIESGALAADQAAKAGADAGVRRDPQGIKGISPFWEALRRGDNSYVARDFDGAIAAYREAITAEPQNALGHYRAGEAQIEKGDLKEAEAAIASGLRFVGNDSMLKAKLEYVWPIFANVRNRMTTRARSGPSTRPSRRPAGRQGLPGLGNRAQEGRGGLEKTQRRLGRSEGTHREAA